MTSGDVEPRYVISIAARMIGVQAHTLRYYERVGLVEPSRSPGNIRLYSERDIGRLHQVKTLMDDLGINLAGVEVILHVLERVAELQHRLVDLESEVERLRQVDYEQGGVR